MLPAGAAGLVLAGVFGATLTAVPSGLNALATASVVDFSNLPRDRQVPLIKLATIGWGCAVAIAAVFLGRLGNIIEIAGKLNGFFGGPLAGAFLLGLFSRRARSWHVIVASLMGAALTFRLAGLGLSWLWYGTSGTAATVLAGWLLAALTGGRRTPPS